MWFKRRKKSEQDHALSESLRSLQSLLSETDRREPSLDPQDPAEGDGRGEAPAAPTRAAASEQPPGAGSGARSTRGDAATVEPEEPVDAGSRWRDLNLSFDAEPVIPKTRRDTRAGVEDRDAAPDMDAASEETDQHPGDAPVDEEPGIAPQSPAGPDHADHAADDEPDATADHDAATEPVGAAAEPAPPAALETEQSQALPDPDSDLITYDLGARPVPPPPQRDEVVQDLTEPGPLAGADDASDTDPGVPAGPARPDEDVLVLDLEEPGPADDAGEPDTDARQAAAGEPDAAEPGDAREEDQLHLELEPDAAAAAEIPVLTNAVYVPDQAAEPATEPAAEPPPEVAGGAPGPAMSAHEARVSRFVDALRFRLQRTGLDALSAGQEKELHDALVELVDELDHD